MSYSTDSYVPLNSAPRVAVESTRVAWMVWAFIVFFAFALVAAIIAAPLAAARGYNGFALAIYQSFSNVCHQIPERSFHIEGEKFAVCSRCFGLYTGFALSVLLYPLVGSLQRLDSPRRIWLFLAAAPIVFDWSLGFFGIWENTHLSRFLTGALFSSVAAIYVVPGLIDLGQSIYRRFSAGAGGAENPATLATQRRSAPSDYSSPSSRI